MVLARAERDEQRAAAAFLKRRRRDRLSPVPKRVRDRYDVHRDIIAWDGEGLHVPDGEPQPYVLLANSRGGEWVDTLGLSTDRIFTALIDTAFEYPGALHFIYGGSYDINEWLRDIDEKTLRKLHATGEASYGSRWYIQYRPRKMFYLRDRIRDVRITVWDAYPWYQRSFVKALEEYLGSDYPALAEIRAMKDRRSQFSEDEQDAIRAYTQMELAALVEIVRLLMERLAAAHIRVRRWDGPGAAAAAILRAKRVKRAMADTPEQIAFPAAVAYSGGRIETLAYGNHEGAIHHYDINSAYPAAMVKLPTLRGGAWRHVTGAASREVHETALYRVEWRYPRDTPKRFYPFTVRCDDGSIYYPPEGAAWVWSPEWSAYVDNARAFDPLEVTVHEAWVFAPEFSTKPLAWVQSMYDVRQQWKREGNAAEWALKLGLNSLYGKLAQTLGWDDEKKPPFYQIEWAGLITSHTRAQLLRAAVQAPDDVIMFATDGIYSRVPLDLQTGKALGEWSYEHHDGLTVVQSGVYFVKDGDEWKTWSRGYNAKEISRDAILNGWRNGVESIDVMQTRFLTLGSALGGRRLSRAWRSWKTAPRTLSLNPTGKRSRDNTRKRARPWTQLVPTFPAHTNGASLSGMSAPYSRAWKDHIDDSIDGVPLLVYESEIEDAMI